MAGECGSGPSRQVSLLKLPLATTVSLVGEHNIKGLEPHDLRRVTFPCIFSADQANLTAIFPTL
jgi:hypothetical protein